jgi:cyanophycin synthetase
VLNAADPLTVAMASYCPGKVIFFSRDPQHPVVQRHAEHGGRTAIVRNGAVVLAEGAHEERIVSLNDVPLTLGGRIAFQIENVLSAAAAAWGAGVPFEAIRIGLTTFVNEPQRVPARFNLLNFDGATVIVDYVHNVDACRAVIDAVSALPHRRRFVVFSAAGDRRDQDIVRQGEMIGDAFDGIILYEDGCNRGRPEGQCLALLHDGVTRGRRVAHTELVRGELRAIEMALRALEPGDLVLVQADQIDETLAFVERYIAEHTRDAKKTVPPAAPTLALGGEAVRQIH